jgi:predicted nucleic acid-binding protein
VTTLVVDASCVVAALLDASVRGKWAANQMRRGPLAAPALLPFEVANVIRRLVRARAISNDIGAQAQDDARELAITLYPFDAVGPRVWELRANLSAYDASYVALAELLEAPLLTCDTRLARAPGGRCPVETPPR